jgi:hypothetical protein
MARRWDTTSARVFHYPQDRVGSRAGSSHERFFCSRDRPQRATRLSTAGLLAVNSDARVVPKAVHRPVRPSVDRSGARMPSCSTTRDPRRGNGSRSVRGRQSADPRSPGGLVGQDLQLFPRKAPRRRRDPCLGSRWAATALSARCSQGCRSSVVGRVLRIAIRAGRGRLISPGRLGWTFVAEDDASVTPLEPLLPGPEVTPADARGGCRRGWARWRGSARLGANGPTVAGRLPPWYEVAGPARRLERAAGPNRPLGT